MSKLTRNKAWGLKLIPLYIILFLFQLYFQTDRLGHGMLKIGAILSLKLALFVKTKISNLILK
jgi:hypothetical protein